VLARVTRNSSGFRERNVAFNQFQPVHRALAADARFAFDQGREAACILEACFARMVRERRDNVRDLARVLGRFEN